MADGGVADGGVGARPATAQYAAAWLPSAPGWAAAAGKTRDGGFVRVLRLRAGGGGGGGVAWSVRSDADARAAVRCVAAAPAGAASAGALAAGDVAGRVAWWDAARADAGPLLVWADAHAAAVHAVAAAGGRAAGRALLVASAGADGAVRLWDPRAPRRPAAEFAARSSEPWAVALPPAPAPPLLAAGYASGAVALWDLRAAAAPLGGPQRGAGPAGVAALAAGPRWLLAGHVDGALSCGRIDGATATAAGPAMELERAAAGAGPLWSLHLFPLDEDEDDEAWLAVSGAGDGGVRVHSADGGGRRSSGPPEPRAAAGSSPVMCVDGARLDGGGGVRRVVLAAGLRGELRVLGLFY